MRWVYVLGPLTLLPLLGGLFLIPQPDDDRGPRFDRARLSLLECHIQGAAFFVFAPSKVITLETGGDGEGTSAMPERE